MIGGLPKFIDQVLFGHQRNWASKKIQIILEVLGGVLRGDEIPLYHLTIDHCQTQLSSSRSPIFPGDTTVNVLALLPKNSL